MKKLSKVLVFVIAICCVVPIPAFAAENNVELQLQDEKPVIVSVETVNENLAAKYDYSSVFPLQLRSTVDLSNGISTFGVGNLKANETYTTDTYTITKSKIKIGLQSLSGASEYIKVTLYKSNGSSVATATLSLPWTSISSATTQYVSFDNLDSSKKYYAVIKNMDTVQSGNIIGVAKQA